MRTETVGARRAGQTVAVGHFDGVHPPGVIERAGDRRGLVEAVLVTDGVHTVPQGDVADVQLAIHADAPAVLLVCRAIRSAVALAAAVMMSRLPA